MKAILSLAAGWLAAIAVVVALVVDARDAAIERSERATAAMAQIMEEQTARTFQAVTLSLDGLSGAWRLSRPARHARAFRELMQENLRDLPYVRAIFVVAPDGRIIHDTDYPKTPDVSLADRDYFVLHRDDPRLQRFVSGPQLSRGTPPAWFVSVSAPVGNGPRFEGIIVAALQPAYFEALYRRIEQGRDEGIALFHRDGTLIARSPPAQDDAGRNYLHLPVFARAAAQRSGSYRGEGHLLPGKRIASYRSVEGLPFLLQVSYGEHAALAEWRRSALGAAIAMGALTLLVGLGLARELRQRARRNAQRAQREQAERLEAMGMLSGGIAHDFGNLLGVISNSLHLLEAPQAGHAPHALEMARRAVHRGREMIDRLLTFASRRPMEIRPADLNLLLTEAHPLIAQALSTRVELVLQLAPGLPLILTDAGQFEMAVINLVVNARDAMDGGGRIVLRTYADERGNPCLAVEDDGTGMPEHVRRRALEPFFTTKGDGGTGLGLAQVYGFMQQSGGALRIDSKPGAGTQVRLRFARARATAPA